MAIGYGVMTLSPVENARLSVLSTVAFAHSESRVIVGGLFTVPLFGLFGQRWRVGRGSVGALAAAAAVCLEPLARIPAGDAIRFRTVSVAEAALGVAMAIYVAAGARTARSAARSGPRSGV